MRDDKSQPPLVDWLEHVLLIAGDGNIEKGKSHLREILIARRNVGTARKFMIWLGGILVASLVFGKQIFEGIVWVVSLKFGGK